MKQLSLLIICASSLFNLTIGQEKINPNFEQVLSLQSISSPTISPDGNHVAYSVQSTDWENNRYDREIWLAKHMQDPFQLTNNKEGNSSNPKWSPDNRWIAFLSNRDDKTQIFVILVNGGEAIPLTNSSVGISDFEWSPDGKQILFTQTEDQSKKHKTKKDLYGGYAIEDTEYGQNQLWLMDFKEEDLFRILTPTESKDTTLSKAMAPQLLIDSKEFTINGFAWSPDGKKIAFDHQPDPFILSWMKSDISIYDMETKSHNLVVNNAGADGFVTWSPDSKSILYKSDLDNTTSNFYVNDNLFQINIDKSGKSQLATTFDENIGDLYWTDRGIYGVAKQKTNSTLLKVLDSKSVELISSDLNRINQIDLTKNGNNIVFTGNTNDGITELYVSEYPFSSRKKITNKNRQISNWNVSNAEVISWKSKDGVEIEGVLHKPYDYDPNKKYPLMVIIHGGPTGTSVPSPVMTYVYPALQWLNKGALILQPNYRGSAGYGEAFRSLNVDNLGVGDMWDVISGVESLVQQGLVDKEKVASMGWSQGGYISAFLTTNSDIFSAISVGAGISNWMTYYVSTDITPFTKQYLNATPWSNEAIYKKTSPMTNINNAKTPTLIQHGEFDRRVPTANAYELYQGLRDMNVDTELIIYKGFGHGITKPKERLVANWHNWKWFAKYIWDEEVEIPME